MNSFLLSSFAGRAHDLPFVPSTSGYISIFCIIFVLVEARSPIQFLHSSVLDAYFSRGFLYTFLGVVCLEQSVAVKYRGAALNKAVFTLGWPALFMSVSAYVIIGVGAVYMFFGVLCIGPCKRGMERQYSQRMEAHRQEKKEQRRRRREGKK